MMNKLDILMELSLVNTIKINLRYFPFSKAIRLPIFISKNIRVQKLSGAVNLQNYRTGSVQIGFGNVGLFDKKTSRGIFNNSGRIDFNGLIKIGHGAKIANSGHLSLGDRFINTAEMTIWCKKKISFGDDCLVSWNTTIVDTDSHKIFDMESCKQLNEDKEILIENNVWIGMGANILKGSFVPNNSIVASNTTVTKQFDATNVVIAGVPARVVKEHIFWEI